MGDNNTNVVPTTIREPASSSPDRVGDGSDIDLPSPDSLGDHNDDIDEPTSTLPEPAVPTSQETIQEDHVQDNVIDVPPTTTPQPAASTSQSINESREISLPLYRAALKGDWETAKRILDTHPDAIRATIASGNHTVLHIAAGAGQASFVKNLVSRMTNEDLALKTSRGFTAFMLAVTSGNVEVAKVLVEKDRNLATVQVVASGRSRTRRSLEDDQQSIMLRTPINLATLYGRQEMVRLLYRSIDVFDDSHLHVPDRHAFFINTISMGIFDVALDMLKRHPELATTADHNGWTALHAMAYKKPQRSSYFPSNSSQQGSIWDHYLSRACSNVLGSKDINQQLELELLTLLWEQVHATLNVSEVKQLVTQPYPLQMAAALNGNVSFLTKLTDHFPDLILMSDDQGRSLFHVAVWNRQEGIFRLIYRFGALKDVVAYKIDPQGNTLLHYAAPLAPPRRLNIVSGAALQFQRELLWFKEVRKVVPPYHEDHKNASGHTAQEVFTFEHKELMAEGEKWMKDTANSCMLVATLIATVVFAVAFTVPGGNTDSGTPFYLKKLSFKIFSISDAISLISSSTSILTFLSILTSRYTEEDFLWSLPSKLIVGLSTLFISIIAMMVAFGAAFFIIFDEGILGVAIAVAGATCVPVLWYALMLRRVFVDLFRSTYMSTSLFN